MEEKTKNLHKQLKNTSIEEYINSHSFDDFDSLNFNLTLNKMLNEKNLKASTIIKNSTLTKSYTYAILKGDRIPNRDKVIIIAISLNCTLEQCNDLLKSSCYRELHPKSKRDSILIFCINQNFSLVLTNIKLENNNCEILH